MVDNLQCYLVGGAVRDILLGMEAKDKDYCVVNSNEEEMLSLGFSKVGDDFPVFLHPETKEEYALARKERKTGSGYGGFETETKNVTLEEDLFRRDLTINAMAMDKEGKLIDPYNGSRDLKNKILRHVSRHFAEDPVRILRICRFAARYNFEIAGDTKYMMKGMVENGEFDHLTKERVLLEFKKVLDEPYLLNFFKNLKEIGALEKIGKFEYVFNKDIQDLLIEAPTREIKNYYVFKDFSEKELTQFGLPRSQIDNMLLLRKWITNTTFYSYMSDEMKLQFFKDMKSRHNEIPSLELASNMFFMKRVPVDVTDFEVYTLKNDIESIKKFNNQDFVNELEKSEDFQALSKKDKIEKMKSDLMEKYSELLYKHKKSQNKI